MEVLLNTPSLKIDGFINPGHVSTILGVEPYKHFSKKVPQVIAGFTAEDVVIAVYMLLKQIAENRTEVENEYTRLVRPEGNSKARELISEVFEIGDAYWRGIGKIPNSGLEIRPKYSEFDAKIKYKDILDNLDKKYQISNIATGCICGAILRGLKEPKDCKLFCKKCTPQNPIGACMVSSEGACGIEAKFRE